MGNDKPHKAQQTHNAYRRCRKQCRQSGKAKPRKLNIKPQSPCGIITENKYVQLVRKDERQKQTSDRIGQYGPYLAPAS